MVSQVALERDPYVAGFASFSRSRSGKEPAWVLDLRRKAIERFEQIGFPTKRHEEWRYTDLSPLKSHRFLLVERVEQMPETAQLAAFSLGSAVAAQLVFIDGHFIPSLSSSPTYPAGITVEPLRQALLMMATDIGSLFGRLADLENHAPACLNTAYMQDGVVIHAARGRMLQAPIHLLFLSTPARTPVASYPRVLVMAEESSRLALIETHATLGGGDNSTSAAFSNSLSELSIGDNAVLDYYKVVRHGASHFHTGSLYARLGRDARFQASSITLGGALVRNDSSVILDGEGGSAELHGLYLAEGQQHVDNHTTIDHARPRGWSRQLYKGVLDGRSSAVFSGKILVRQDAQKTDAVQTSQNLLLSETAEANAKPQLEIYADDVKCTHGATVGQLDAEALFYLRSRGIDKETARRILIHGYMSEVVALIAIETLRLQIESNITERIPQPSSTSERGLVRQA
ncbi:MAG: Fe-S cluster assembly protein SufD [Planctomycetota bacterium]